MENIRKKNRVEKRKKIVITKMIILIAIIVISNMSLIVTKQVIRYFQNKSTDLNTLVVTGEESSNKEVYLNVSSIPYQFAIHDQSNNSYYIVSDGKYLYITYMDRRTFEKLNREDITKIPRKIRGVTAIIPENVKQIALEAWNERVTEEEKISLEEFHDYFGDIYLDATKGYYKLKYLLLFFYIVNLIAIFSIVPLIFRLASFYAICISTREKIKKEIEENSFCEESLQLYLTNNYIIQVKRNFDVIPYQEIVWLYPYEKSENGVKTKQAIKIRTKEGKTYTIANMEVITPSQKDLYDNIWKKIVFKCQNSLIGYTQENIEIFDKIILCNQKNKK